MRVLLSGKPGAVQALNASGSDLASLDPPNLENFDYSNFVSSIVDLISTPISATINGEVIEPIPVLSSTIADNGYLPKDAGDYSGLDYSVTQASLYVENNAPTGAVVISGLATQGTMLTANTSALADADGLGTLIYQWKADGTNITGATASTYTLTQDEVGKTITVAVSYTDGEGTSESVLSSATTSVTNVNDDPTGNVAITGTATQGGTLTADTSALDDADGLGTLSYQWKADGSDISGATSSTYTLTQAEVGKAITVAVSYTDGEGTSESVLSAASAAVTNTNDPVSGAVSITGTATQGQVLTADASGLSDSDGVGAFSYVWKADGTTISGATGSTYTLTQAEVGKTITVTASYTVCDVYVPLGFRLRVG